MMIKTLLADDNKITIEYLEKMIDWEKHGFEIIATAADGIEAWDQFLKNMPDVVITDVKMPGLNGIELTKKIKEYSPDTVIVFISSYEEFSYVHSALNLGVHDYILKHETRTKVIYEKLDLIKKELDKSSRGAKRFLEAEFLLRLFDSDSSSAAEPFTETYSLILLEQKKYLPILSELTKEYSGRPAEDKTKQICYNISESVVSIVKIDTYQYALLVTSCIDPETLCLKLQNSLGLSTGFDFFTLICCENNGIADCIDSFHFFKKFAKVKYFYRIPTVLKYKDFSDELCDPISDPVPEKDNLQDMVDRNAKDDLLNLIDTCYSEASKHFDYTYLSKFTEELFRMLCDYEKNILDNESKSYFKAYCDDDLRLWCCSDDIKKFMKKKFSSLCDLFFEKQVSVLSLTVRETINYIKNNYMNIDLSMEDIAGHVGLSVNRLSVVMKNEVGFTVWRYLTDTRIEHAKKLLKGKDKISDICEKVGYSNISYFSRVFKKMCGVSPAGYRRRK